MNNHHEEAHGSTILFKVLCLAFGILVAIAACMAQHQEEDRSAQQQAVEYCRMVHDKGWPDYRHVYAWQCNIDGSVNWDYVEGRK